MLATGDDSGVAVMPSGLHLLDSRGDAIRPTPVAPNSSIFRVSSVTHPRPLRRCANRTVRGAPTHKCYIAEFARLGEAVARIPGFALGGDA